MEVPVRTLIRDVVSADPIEDVPAQTPCNHPGTRAWDRVRAEREQAGGYTECLPFSDSYLETVSRTGRDTCFPGVFEAGTHF